ncbi:MAG: thioredoxin fold domain-containing protein [Elusimicrobia bacterium]|nr:thioredoxin fold domain-containing protein [Elusimicrobiota bacterium]
MHIEKHNVGIIMGLFITLVIGCAQQPSEKANSEPKKTIQTSAQKKKEADNDQQGIKTPTAKSEVKKSQKLTLLELGSVKCIPCKKMKPILDEIEEKYSEQVDVVFHDVWTEQGGKDAEKYNIRLIPTQVFLDKSGEEYFRHEGFYPLDEIIAKLKEGGLEE